MPGILAVAGVVFAVLVLDLIFLVYFLSCLILARQHGIETSIFEIIGMRLRRIPPKRILRCLIALKKADVPELSSQMLQDHHVAGGSVEAVTEAAIQLRQAGETIDPLRILAADLGR